jgi:hypothetical protein
MKRIILLRISDEDYKNLTIDVKYPPIESSFSLVQYWPSISFTFKGSPSSMPVAYSLYRQLLKKKPRVKK